MGPAAVGQAGAQSAVELAAVGEPADGEVVVAAVWGIVVA